MGICVQDLDSNSMNYSRGLKAQHTSSETSIGPGILRDMVGPVVAESQAWALALTQVVLNSWYIHDIMKLLGH